VDDVPDGREDEVTRTDVPVTRREPSGPATDRVRIVGAEPAGEITGELPVVPGVSDPEDGVETESRSPDPTEVMSSAPDDFGLGQATVRLTDQPGDPERSVPGVNPVAPGQTAVPSGIPAPTELPHWTEPPTGQVPAVLARDSGDEGAGSGIVAPTWREEDADWVAHDEEFEPAMLAGDQVALGSLDETDDSDVERRPWEFNLDAVKPGAPSPHRGDGPVAGDPITEPVDVVAAAPEGYQTPVDESVPVEQSRPSGARFGAGGPGPGEEAEAPTAWDEQRSGPGRVDPVPAATDAESTDEEQVPDEKLRPTGSARLGRARRNGLRPRMRAKRPAEVDALANPPLAAEPPGASVTDVPGAGRRRGGLASLAAADRTAVGVGDPGTLGAEGDDESVAEGSPTGPDGTTTTGGGRRRLHRRPAADRPRSSGRVPVASAAVAVEEGGTGGGPPLPRRPRQPATEPNQLGTGPHEDGSSIGIRVGTGLAVAVVALLAFKLGSVPAVVLATVVVTFAAGESFGVLRRAGYHPATLLGLVGTISLMVGAYSKGIAALPLVLVLITVFTLVWYLFGIERGSPVAGTAATLMTVGWVSLLGSYAGLLLAPSSFPNRHGIAFLLGAIIATVANDIGALVIGGWLGSRPLAPTISPNKTWEGLFGGAVFSILVSTVVVGSIHPWSPSNAALLGVVVAVVAPIGDLCESLLKRDLRLKDMGTLLPGHGGVLDRVDALLFVLPATYYLVRALNIA
jgi:CDP-diglyceride synthetase